MFSSSKKNVKVPLKYNGNTLLWWCPLDILLTRSNFASMCKRILLTLTVHQYSTYTLLTGSWRTVVGKLHIDNWISKEGHQNKV